MKERAPSRDLEATLSERASEVDLIHWAERFIATPSVSRDGNAAIAALAAELAAEVGVPAKLEEQVIGGVAQVTLRADLGPAAQADGLLLLTHLDTVPPGDPAAWTATSGDPFRPTRSADRLYGLGSADAKVDLVCKLAALGAIEPGRLRRPLRLVGTYGEEIGLLGARDFVARGGTSGMRWALVGEPSELVAVRAHKGYAVYEARLELAPAAAGGPARSVRESVRGVSAHSSTPELGSSAIETALERLARPDVVSLQAIAGGDTVNKVADLCNLDLVLGDAAPAPRGPAAASPALDPAPLVRFARAWRELRAELARSRDADFDPAHTVVNLGVVRTEGRSVVFSFDVRTIPGADVTAALRVLAAHAELRLVRENPPLATPPASALVAAVTRAQQQIGVPVRVGTKATSTEAGLLSAAGLDAVVIGAGLSVGNVHKPNEHTRISELALARDLYRSVIEQLCMEGQPCSC